MSLQITHTRPAATTSERGAPDIERLMRDLVRNIPHAGPATRPELASAEQVVFEIDIDGAHYRLLRSQAQPPAERVSLSPRELAIAQLIAKGLPNKTIGDILEISPWTVATHLRRIFVKLGVTSRAAMVARLVEEALF